MQPPGQPRVLHATTHIGAEPGGASGVQRYAVAENGDLYCVKLKGNRQGLRALPNEYVSGRIAEILGIPVGETALVTVPEALLPRSDARIPNPIAGTQFGTRRYEDGQTDENQLRTTQNYSEFCGVVVFDTFIARADSRQNLVYPSSGVVGAPRDRGAIFDQGFAFTGQPHWTVASLGAPHNCDVKDELGVKRSFADLAHYEPYLVRLEQLQEVEIRALVQEAPLVEWGVSNEEADALVGWLNYRKALVRGVIETYLR